MTVDQSQTGCPMNDDKAHAVSWVRVPAHVMNEGTPDEVVLYSEHLAGFCWNCDEHFTASTANPKFVLGRKKETVR